MKGNCGSEFKPYTSSCEECRYYEHCMNKFKEDKPTGDNFPVIQDASNKLESNLLNKLPKITSDDIIEFHEILKTITPEDIMNSNIFEGRKKQEEK